MIRRTRKTGLPPGTPVLIGERKLERLRITVFEYDGELCEERELAEAAECRRFTNPDKVTWINLDGIHDIEAIQEIGRIFNIHPLVIEDILNTEQRPKVETHEQHLFITLKMLSIGQEDDSLLAEQVSLVLGRGYVLSFQEREGDVFDFIRDRLRQGKGLIRRKEADYLAYALIDAVVDHYFVVLEKLEERIQALEEAITGDPTPESMQAIHSLRKEMIVLRRSTWPLREQLNTMLRDKPGLISNETLVFLRDVYDHTIQVIEISEALQDILSGLHDVYLSLISNRLNSIMKVLTIIATIFIPLTFIAGVYGMNFRFMPELEWRWGYPLVWILMLGIFIGMLLFFKRKKWL